MRHRISGVKLNRSVSHRKALFRNMVTSLLKYDRITTTETKAKEIRRWADHIVTLAKRGDLHARRQAMAIVFEKNVVHKLFETVTERFGGRNGGYTRLIKIGRRPGDAAPLTLVEMIRADGATARPTRRRKPKVETPPGKEASGKSPEGPTVQEKTVAGSGGEGPLAVVAADTAVSPAQEPAADPGDGTPATDAVKP